MKLSSILSLAAAIGTSTTLFTSAQHHNLPPTDTSKFNGINSPTNSIVPNDVVAIAADDVAVDDADDESRKLMVHDDKHDNMFAMIEAVMEEEFGLTAADGDDGGRRLSKSNKSGKGIDPEDKVLGFAFIAVGFLEIVGIIDDDDGTAILTQLSLALTTGEDDEMNGVRKLMEGAILDKDDIKKNIHQIIKDVMTAGGRRLQTGGTIDSLGLAWFFVGILINQGVPFETIVDERLGAFTQRVVDTIEGILFPGGRPFTCPTVSGSVADGDACCASEDCINFGCLIKGRRCGLSRIDAGFVPLDCSEDNACTQATPGVPGTCTVTGDVCFGRIAEDCTPESRPAATGIAGFCGDFD